MEQSPPASGRSHLLLGAGDPPSGFRRESDASGDLIAVLYDQTSDEWQRARRSRPGPGPRREVLIDVVAVARGGAAAGSTATQVVPGHDIALRTVERPVASARLVEDVASCLDADGAAAATVYVDDVAAFVADVGLDDAVAALERLTDRLHETGGTGVFRLDPDAVPTTAVERLRDAVDDTGGDDAVDPDEAAIDALRAENPTNFGYARNHWPEAKRGLERCDRNYPRARQVHEALEAPDTSPRTLGSTLKALVALDVLDTWSETVASTRYDLTAYDPARMEAVGAALDATTN